MLNLPSAEAIAGYAQTDLRFILRIYSLLHQVGVYTRLHMGNFSVRLGLKYSSKIFKIFINTEFPELRFILTL